METAQAYYRLAKPGIVYGNLLAGVAGFLFASKGHVNGWLLVYFAIGISLVMACGCVLNNILDKEIDKKMARTKRRALVTGQISSANAFGYGAILGVVGFGILGFFTNVLCVALGGTALFLYVVVYGIAKRKSVHGTLVGALPGALPPVAGYAVVTGRLDAAAALIFLAMLAWQMPHFYAIAMYRKKEYQAAGIPVITVRYGNKAAKQQMLAYIILFVLAALALTFYGLAGTVFAVAIIIAGLLWLWKIRQGFHTKNDDKWSRGMFGLSLKILLLFCMLLSVEAWLS